MMWVRYIQQKYTRDTNIGDTELKQEIEVRQNDINTTEYDFFEIILRSTQPIFR